MKVFLTKGFSMQFSKEAFLALGLIWDEELYGYLGFSLNLNENEKEFRTKKEIIEVIEKLGKKVNFDENTDLYIVEVSDDVEFYIEQNEGGGEVIHEKHRTWS